MQKVFKKTEFPKFFLSSEIYDDQSFRLIPHRLVRDALKNKKLSEQKSGAGIKYSHFVSKSVGIIISREFMKKRINHKLLAAHLCIQTFTSINKKINFYFHSRKKIY